MNPNSSSSIPWDIPTTRSVSSSLQANQRSMKKNERSDLNSYPQTTVHIHRKYTTPKQLKDHKPHPKTPENSTKPTSSQTQTHHQQDPQTENHHHQFKKKKTHRKCQIKPSILIHTKTHESPLTHTTTPPQRPRERERRDRLQRRSTPKSTRRLEPSGL